MAKIGAGVARDAQEKVYDFKHFNKGSAKDKIQLIGGTIQMALIFVAPEDDPEGVASEVEGIGKWENTGESMSENAASYQEFITGVDADKSYRLNGVKFDGIKNGTLVDAKSGMENFVDKSGNFKKWFTGKMEIINQARRQIKAAKGTPIEWHFENENVMKAVKSLFEENNIKGIKLIYTPKK